MVPRESALQTAFRSVQPFLHSTQALRAWRDTANYCRDMLRLFYADDHDVVTDTELQVVLTSSHSALSKVRIAAEHK